MDLLWQNVLERQRIVYCNLKTAILICSSNYIGWFIISTAIIIIKHITDFIIIDPDNPFHFGVYCCNINISFFKTIYFNPIIFHCQRIFHMKNIRYTNQMIQILFTDLIYHILVTLTKNAMFSVLLPYRK